MMKPLPSIKAIILDVDGVIVGQNIGFNSPHPHKSVILALKEIRNKGILISLCTAKPHFAITKIIKDAELDNVHITDGGGVIVNPLSQEIVKQNNVPTASAIRAIAAFIKEDIYTEVYTVDNYVIQNSQECKITEKHAHVLQSKPLKAASLIKYVENNKITKVMPVAQDEDEKPELARIFKPFANELTLSWGVHPVILPLQFGIITAPGISKKQGAIEISTSTGIPLENTLGVGDSTSDWQFIEMCEYAGAMGNATDQLKELVKSKGNENSFIGETVDENGVIDILKYFGLMKL